MKVTIELENNSLDSHGNLIFLSHYHVNKNYVNMRMQLSW